MATVACVLCCAAPAGARPFSCPSVSDQDRIEQARTLFEDALKLEASAPDEALARLECAASFIDRPAIQLRIGVICERLSLPDRAVAAYRRYLELAGDSAPDRQAMEARIDKLRSHVPAPASAGRRIAGWVVFGSGTAIAIAGAALLGSAKALNDRAHAVAPGTVAYDSSEVRGRLDRAEVHQSLGIGGIALGVAMTGVGLAIALTPSVSGSRATAAPGFGFGLHGLAVRIPF
jgi:hypothetical protein